jgi:hypothetical protein
VIEEHERLDALADVAGADEASDRAVLVAAGAKDNSASTTTCSADRVIAAVGVFTGDRLWARSVSEKPIYFDTKYRQRR